MEIKKISEEEKKKILLEKDQILKQVHDLEVGETLQIMDYEHKSPLPQLLYSWGRNFLKGRKFSTSTINEQHYIVTRKL